MPASDAALALTLQSYGARWITAGNDLNLTLNTLNLATYGPVLDALAMPRSMATTPSPAARGVINLLGSGASPAISRGAWCWGRD